MQKSSKRTQTHNVLNCIYDIKAFTPSLYLKLHRELAQLDLACPIDKCKKKYSLGNVFEVMPTNEVKLQHYHSSYQQIVMHRKKNLQEISDSRNEAK